MENLNNRYKFRAWQISAKEMIEEILYKRYGAWTNHDFFKSDEFIPMQYTGLLDKHGVEIYEGDICQIDLGDCEESMVKGQIIWQCLGWVWDYYQNDEVLSEFESSEIEVIGNIHEHGYLLDEK